MSKGKLSLGVGVLAVAGVVGGVMFWRSRQTPPLTSGAGIPPANGMGNSITGASPIPAEKPKGSGIGIPLPGGRKGQRITADDVVEWTSAAKGFWNTVTETKAQITG